MKKINLIAVIFFICASSACAEISATEFDYTVDDTIMKGYLAYDNDIEGKRPGVLVVHEWWGHNEYARARAEQLAELGYTGFAIDMYGEGKVADHPDDAGKFAGAVKSKIDTLGKKRFLKALEILKAHPTVNSAKIAAIGYCFGGGMVLHMARYGIDLDGVVSFHGSLNTDTPAEKGKVKAKVLVCHGADDPFIPEEQIKSFKMEMEDAGVDYQFMSYPGAVHSFTNPGADAMSKEFGMPIAYNEAADKKSWADMQAFFDSIFAD